MKEHESVNDAAGILALNVEQVTKIIFRSKTAGRFRREQRDTFGGDPRPGPNEFGNFNRSTLVFSCERYFRAEHDCRRV